MTMRFFGLIPAAGKSVRMGRPKLTLPLGGRTVVERVIDAFREAGVTDVIVVAGPEASELRDVAERAGAAVHLLAEQTPDMRATVLRGLDVLEQRFQATTGDAFFLMPADHPATDPAVIRAISATAMAESAGSSIWIPTYAGKRGHPALIAWRHASGIRAIPEGAGLNSYLRQHTAETHELSWGAGDILVDLDTPEDYARLKRRFENDSGS